MNGNTVWEKMTGAEKKAHIKAKTRKPLPRAPGEKSRIDPTPKLPDDIWASMSEEEKKAHIKAKKAAKGGGGA